VNRKHRIAAVGLGWVALHRHIPALLRHPDLELVGVVDRHTGLAARIADHYHLPFSAEAESLSIVPWLADEVDAITIGAPPMAHRTLACEAFALHKHVLTEKPFAMSVTEGEAMRQAAQEAGQTLSIVHNFQFSRAALKLKRDLAAGRLGPIARVAAVQLGNPRRRLPAWYETLPLGLFYDESPHFFYLLDSLAKGGLTLQKAHGVADDGKNTPRLAHILYRDTNGTPFTIDCDFTSTLSEWHVRVTGDKATAILDIFRDIYILLPNDGAHGATDILRTSLYAITQHLAQHIPNGLSLLRGRLDYGNNEIIHRFATALASGQNDPLIGADKALAVLKLQHEATQAIQESLLP